MRIGIVGAGNIGSALTTRFTAAGYEVQVANSRGPETLTELARATGARAVPVGEAARGADVVVITIPEGKVPDLPAGVLDGAAANAVVIDTGNYYPERDGRIDAIEKGTTESRWVADQLGHPVVKAFNTIYARHLLELGRPSGHAGRIALPVAGDDPAAKRKVMDLVEAIGFDAVDAGSIDESWRQQPGTAVYAKDLDAESTRRALSEEQRRPREAGS